MFMCVVVSILLIFSEKIAGVKYLSNVVHGNLLVRLNTVSIFSIGVLLTFCLVMTHLLNLLIYRTSSFEKKIDVKRENDA